MRSNKLFVALVPRAVWEKWPDDRSLSLLASDADALRRRAKKRVNAAVQRTLYIQLSRRIDALALEAARSGKASARLWRGAWADSTVGLIRLIAEAGNKLKPESGKTAMLSASLAGRSYFAAGAESMWFKDILSNLDQAALAKECQLRGLNATKIAESRTSVQRVIESADPNDTALVFVLE